MGSRVLHWWECDRCGVTDSGDDTGYQPKKWVTIKSANPPKSAEDTALAILCDGCADKLDKWLHYKTAMPTPGPKTPSNDELVAVMREAEARGRKPHGLLGERFGVSEATAYRYLKRARMAALTDGREEP